MVRDVGTTLIRTDVAMVLFWNCLPNLTPRAAGTKAGPTNAAGGGGAGTLGCRAAMVMPSALCLAPVGSGGDFNLRQGPGKLMTGSGQKRLQIGEE